MPRDPDGLDGLRHERQRLRERGQRVVFTNGCFDLLHTGHVQLLESARREGDFLIVGLNSDASVRGNKGPSRPVIPEHERAETLLALESVDRVLVYDLAEGSLRAAARTDPTEGVKSSSAQSINASPLINVTVGGQLAKALKLNNTSSSNLTDGKILDLGSLLQIPAAGTTRQPPEKVSATGPSRSGR